MYLKGVKFFTENAALKKEVKNMLNDINSHVFDNKHLLSDDFAF